MKGRDKGPRIYANQFGHDLQVKSFCVQTPRREERRDRRQPERQFHLNTTTSELLLDNSPKTENGKADGSVESRSQVWSAGPGPRLRVSVAPPLRQFYRLFIDQEGLRAHLEKDGPDEEVPSWPTSGSDQLQLHMWLQLADKWGRAFRELIMGVPIRLYSWYR
ncbi:unnamed protein product [Bursaphelenchus xylophilus]|uniref:(pine wood nematode) hypothetical protein n=1 Tax=Bursaphelenchus xylophilus TaxID=6326 RepID=A0A1I7SUE8_BURXY|nr:unnamed protein product [Bursaphelenchus xylophilus]CAG9107220.1 unnamed protein product [Bursaphelenchus xylophilus]